MSFSSIGSEEDLISTSATSYTASVTVPDLATNSIGIVLVNLAAVGATGRSITGITWNGDSMTQAVVATYSTSGQQVAIYYRADPDDNGTYNIVVSFDGTAIIRTGSIVTVWASASTAVSLDDTSSANGSSADPLTITSTQAGANELVVSTSVSTANALAAPAVSGCTELQSHDWGGDCSVSAYSVPTGSGDATHTHDYSQAGSYAIASASFKEAAGTAYTQDVSGAITFDGSVSKSSRKPLDGALTFTGDVSKRTSKGLTGALTFVGDLAKRAGKALDGAITFDGVLSATKTVLVSLSGAITFAGDLTKRTSKGLTGALTFAGDLAKRTSRGLDGALTFAGDLTKRAGKALDGAVTFSGAVTAIKTALITLEGAISFAGDLTKRTSKGLDGALALVGDLTKRTSKAFDGTLTFTGDLTKRAGKALAGAITFTGDMVKRTGKALAGEFTSSGLLEALKGASNVVLVIHDAFIAHWADGPLAWVSFQRMEAWWIMLKRWRTERRRNRRRMRY